MTAASKLNGMSGTSKCDDDITLPGGGVLGRGGIQSTSSGIMVSFGVILRFVFVQ